MGKKNLSPGWQIKGTYNEACASEGQCPIYFQRSVEGGCRYYMVYRIEDGIVDEVNLAGSTVIYNGDFHYSEYEDIVAHGSEGGVYICDTATEEQRHVLDNLVITSLGGRTMKQVHAVKYVKIDITEEEGTFQVKMPFGEMKQRLVKGNDGGPVIFENIPTTCLSNFKPCHTFFWTYKDLGKNFEYENRCGTWANFVFQG